VQRSGRNIGGYRGESIDIQKVLQNIEREISDKHWVCDRVRLMSANASHPVEFLAFRRALASAKNRVYLSTGIHGDEPAGPLAVLQLLKEDRWPRDTAVWLCPCLNLTGFPLNRRENHEGIDLNRDYRQPKSEEIRAHIGWLAEQPNFDVALCLHEDWESPGFYVYELNPDNQLSFAPRIIERVSEVCPIDTASTIENWPAQEGVIRPSVNPADRPQWPESIYLISNNTRLSYTLEAPSDYPLPVRVSALVTAVRAVLESLGGQ
jgi:predicted deacylase